MTTGIIGGERHVGAAEAVEAIRSGDRVYIHPGCAEPEILVDAMVARAGELHDVEIVHLMTMGAAGYVAPGMEKHFRHNSLFTGANVRQAIHAGRADFTPVFLSEVPRLFTDRFLPIDVALVQVSPPDEHGFLSFGVGVDCTKAAAESARTIIAQVNPRMPRTLGDSFIHVSKIHHLVQHESRLLELAPDPIGCPEAKAIGAHVAELIEDGSTLQTGIGAIPDAVLDNLHGKRDLGMHTEMFSDGIVRLVAAGVVNNERKTLHRGKIVASFMLGTRALYDFVDNNPLIELHPSDYVNDPFVISRHEKMVSINSALQVDLTGQVCADSIGHRNYSGFGGQLDFIRGAARSRGGKPIIALPSTARGGTISRIVSVLSPGSGVTTTRGDVHDVVTEHGVAHLYGRTIRERARALIAIADPRFRDQLRAEAAGLNYL
jgi:4-hydroxybutyrate CoA-transferase